MTLFLYIKSTKALFELFAVDKILLSVIGKVTILCLFVRFVLIFKNTIFENNVAVHYLLTLC